MVYIIISSSELGKANQFVKTLDPQGGDAFIENKKVDKDGYCVISLPDDGSPFVEAMKDKFGFTDYFPNAYNTKGITEAKATVNIKSTSLPTSAAVGAKVDTMAAMELIKTMGDSATSIAVNDGGDK